MRKAERVPWELWSVSEKPHSLLVDMAVIEEAEIDATATCNNSLLFHTFESCDHFYRHISFNWEVRYD